MKTLILVNPNSDKAKDREFLQNVENHSREAFGRDGLTEVRYTDGSKFSQSLVRAALKEGVENIVVVGGDGTLSETIQGLFQGGSAVSPMPTLALVPSGRGNDFAKSLQGTRSYRELENLEKGTERRVDCGVILFQNSEGEPIGERYFINVVSFGFPGLVDQRVHQKKGALGSLLGGSSLTYVYQSLESLREYRATPVRVWLDGNLVFDSKLYAGFILNGSYNAGGVCWSQTARVDDGLFHVLLFEELELKSLGLLPSLIDGSWKGKEGVHSFIGKQLRIEFQRQDFPFFDVDGDQPEPEDCGAARISILERALKFRA